MEASKYVKIVSTREYLSGQKLVAEIYIPILTYQKHRSKACPTLGMKKRTDHALKATSSGEGVELPIIYTFAGRVHGDFCNVLKVELLHVGYSSSMKNER